MADDLEKRITAKVVLDDTGFNSSLRGVNEELKETKSEFKLASEGLKTYGKTTEQLKQAQQALSRQFDLQKEKVEMYRQSIEKTREKMQQNILARDKLKESLEQCKEAYNKIISTQSKVLESYRKNETQINKLNSSYEKAKKSYGENSEECIKLKEQIEKLEKEQQKLINSNRKEIESYQKVQTELNETTEAYNKKASAVETNARAEQTYERHLNNANAELVRTQGQLGNVNRDIENNSNKWLQSSKILGEHSKKLKDTGEKVSDLGDSFLMLNVPLALAGGYALHTGMDFEYSMSGVQATAGATKQELGQLTDVAVDLGAKTKYNATQVSEGMQDLASAGFSVNEIIEAMPGNLNLAASSGEDLATSSEIAATTLRGFGLQASYAGHVADVLAKNAAETNASVSSTGMAMKYIAPVAHSMGLSLEEVTASIGLLSDAGIKGTQAGTTLRTALVNLSNPSDKAAKAMHRIGFNAFDAQGKMLPLDAIIKNLQHSTQGLTDKQKQQVIATIFGKEALSGMLALIDAGPDKLHNLSNSLKDSDGAAKKMADTMQDNAKTSVEQMMGSIESASIKLEQNLAPSIKSVADTVGNLADKFGNLDPSVQKMIAGTVAGGLAFGGLAKILGGTAKSIGNVMDLAGKITGKIGTARKATEIATIATEGVTTAIEGAGTATVVAEGATAGLGGALATIAPIAIPLVAVIGGIGYAAYKIHSILIQKVIPTTDLFADKVKTTTTTLNGVSVVVDKTTTKISEGTKKAVGAYMQLDKKAKESLTDLYVNSTKITKDNANKLVTLYKQMNKKIEDGNDKRYKDELTNITNIFKNSKKFSKKEQQEILKNMQNGHKKQQAEQDKYQKRIEQILNTAKEQHRNLTIQEQQEINSIQDKMRVNAVNSLSKQKADSEILLERLKDYGTKITAEQASNIIKNAEKQRQKSVDEANQQYQKTVENIVHMRDDTHEITSDQAQKLIDAAKKQRDGVVDKANEMKRQVVDKVKEQDRDVENQVNTSTGNVKTTLDGLISWWNGVKIAAKHFEVKVSKIFEDLSGSPMGNIGHRWTGDTNFKGGLTTLNERGDEIVDLPQGSRIFTHYQSQEMIQQTAEDTARKIAKEMLSDFQQTGDIIIPINIAGKKIDEVIVPRVSNALAMNTKRGR